MPALAGKRYVAPSGATVIVTKGATGDLSDAGVSLSLQQGSTPPTGDSGRTEPLLAIGKRYRSVDGECELLVIRPGVCDLHYNGEPMQLLATKVLPSAD
jgi:hypothetical protein